MRLVYFICCPGSCTVCLGPATMRTRRLVAVVELVEAGILFRGASPLLILRLMESRQRRADISTAPLSPVSPITPIDMNRGKSRYDRFLDQYFLTPTSERPQTKIAHRVCRSWRDCISGDTWLRDDRGVRQGCKVSVAGPGNKADTRSVSRCSRVDILRWQ